MDNNNQAPNNVIQFPGRKPEAEANKPAAPEVKTKKPAHKGKKTSKKNVGASVLAIMLFTGAVNKYVYSGSESADLSSTNGREIASVQPLNWKRDAAWEKALAEKLASPQARSTASLNIGRAATKEEKLRWGTLEEKYTITYEANQHKINGIVLQDAGSNPSYVLDRAKFLNEYGALFEGSFDSAKLKSVEKSDDKTVESYLILDKDRKAKVEARFELDRFKRLISLKVEPVKI